MSALEPDAPLRDIADYLLQAAVEREEAFQAAAWSLADSLGCAMLALQFPDCRRRLGPLVDGAVTPGGCRVPGTGLELDPVAGAFNLGAMVRWLDYNDTWLAAEWGHPSDTIAGLLAAADWLSRGPRHIGDRRLPAAPVTVRGLLEAQVKAYEIQGVLALENAFNRVGLDHVILVKVATAGAVTRLLGGGRAEIVSAVSNAWMDGGPLRGYRHAPNTGPRKSWAAADAASRGVRLALMALAGEPGYPAAISAPTWGVQDALLRGAPLRIGRPFGSYVAENILFKVSFPAEFHAQTAVEAALRLHPAVRDRLPGIRRVRIRTQESARRIIDKRGPLRNPADRDHCIQYAVAIALIHGELRAEHYEDDAAADPRVDALRETMEVVEDPGFSSDYRDPGKRSIANAVQVFFQDGSATPEEVVEYPLGHRQRRADGIPLLFDKLRGNLRRAFPGDRAASIAGLLEDRRRLETLEVPALVDLFV